MVLYISNASQLGKPSLQQTAGSPYGPCRKSDVERNGLARCRACGTRARPPAMPVSGSIAVGRNVGVGVNSDRRKPSTPMTSHSGRIVAPHQLTRRASHSTRQSIGPAGCWAAPGATSTPGCGCKRASTATSSIGLQPGATMLKFSTNPTPTRWGMPARWCCIWTEPTRAFTIPCADGRAAGV